MRKPRDLKMTQEDWDFYVRTFLQAFILGLLLEACCGTAWMCNDKPDDVH